MAMPRHAMRLTLLAVLAVLAGAAIASACGSSNTDSNNQPAGSSPAATDALAARVQRDEMLNAIVTLGNLGIHDLDTAAQNGKIDNKYLPTVRLVVRLVALTDWTDDVKPLATKLHDDGVTLLQALEAGKGVEAVKPLSTDFHEAYHSFTDPVWDSLVKGLPPDAGGPSAHETPSAGGTEMHEDAGATPAGDHMP